jgi:hypothetical protein
LGLVDWARKKKWQRQNERRVLGGLRVQRTCKLDVELKIGECASAGQIRDRRKVDIQMLDT